MSSSTLRLGAIVLLLFVAAATGLKPVPEAAALSNCSVSNLSMDSEEWQFLQLINSYRGAGNHLTVSVNLNRMASWHARDMAVNNYFSHNDSAGRDPTERAEDCDSPFDAGENIAAGTFWDDAEEAFAAWQNSPGHNQNMLDSNYQQIGIARYFDANSEYGWYWVTDFTYGDDGTRINPPPPSTPCTAPTIKWSTDSSPSAGGSVTFSWNTVSGANSYRVARRENGAWVVKGTVTGTTYSHSDMVDDPEWRIYVATGTCTPAPGPARVFDPGTTPAPQCIAPPITSNTDTDSAGAGLVTFSWHQVAGATQYRVAMRQGSTWVVKATTSNLSFSGADGAGDPQWRVYITAGTCSPITGPATVFDP